jgi:hypothetical protein
MAVGVLFFEECAPTVFRKKDGSPFFYKIKAITGAEHDTGKRGRYSENSLYRQAAGRFSI